MQQSFDATWRQAFGACLFSLCLVGLTACGDGEAEMPKETPASVDREVVSPVGADDEPAEPVPPSVPANTAPEVGEPDRPEQ